MQSDDVAIDFDSGVITDKTTGQTFQGQAFPEFMQKIIKAEGLVIISIINKKCITHRCCLMDNNLILLSFVADGRNTTK